MTPSLVRRRPASRSRRRLTGGARLGLLRTSNRKFDRARDLVDVLAARPGRADEAFAQFLIGNEDARIDAQALVTLIAHRIASIAVAPASSAFPRGVRRAQLSLLMTEISGASSFFMPWMW